MQPAFPALSPEVKQRLSEGGFEPFAHLLTLWKPITSQGALPRADKYGAREDLAPTAPTFHCRQSVPGPRYVVPGMQSLPRLPGVAFALSGSPSF